MHDACARGDVATVQQLLDSQPTAERRVALANCEGSGGDDGSRPLHWAARGNHYNLLRLLVESGARVNERNRMLSTALHWAAAHLHVESIQVLCALGAEINTRDKWGYGPLHLAVRKRCLRGADVMLLYGGDVNFKAADGSTALHMACEAGDLDSVQWLLDKERIIANARDTAGETPLLRAASSGQMEVVEYLLRGRQTATVWNLRDKKGQSLVHRAAIYGNRDLLMLIANVNPAVCAAMMNEGDHDRRTPLHHAVMRRHFREVKALLTLGADVDAQDKDGNTALHMAVLSGQARTARFLHQSGANADCKNKRGETARMAAKRTNVKF